jgi:putative ABC transport system permease protein
LKGLEYIGGALKNMRKNRARSVLTMLGIIIGIAAIIIVMSLGSGGKIMIQSELEQFGINRFWIYANTASKGVSAGADLTNQDVELLRKRMDTADICPGIYKKATISCGDNKLSVDIVGTDESYLDVWQLEMESGRFITENDSKYGHRVVVLSYQVAKDLFNTRSPVGEEVEVAGYSFTVAGVQKNSSSLISQQLTTDKIFVPLGVFQELWSSGEKIDEISISAKSAAQVDAAGKQAVAVLQQKNGEKGIYRTFNLSKEMQLADNILDTFSLVIGCIAGISLIIGGVGIMNIMLVTVKERTREIGIKKALGARRSHILYQFLTEALCYSLTGGVLGILLGIALSKLASEIISLPSVLLPKVMVLSVLFAVGIGLFFGIYPAYKASKLDPVEALRYE